MQHGDRDEFIERIARLAGETTYRVPVGGRGSRVSHLPDAHAIAAALAFARRGPDDIGPDVAYCWVLQSDCYRNRVVRLLATALRCHEFRHAGGEARLHAAESGWVAAYLGAADPRPDGEAAVLGQPAACGRGDAGARGVGCPGGGRAPVSTRKLNRPLIFLTTA